MLKDGKNINFKFSITVKCNCSFAEVIKPNIDFTKHLFT